MLGCDNEMNIVINCIATQKHKEEQTIYMIIESVSSTQQGKVNTKEGNLSFFFFHIKLRLKPTKLVVPTKNSPKVSVKLNVEMDVFIEIATSS